MTDEHEVAMDDFPVVLRLPLLWGDMDALGHVNNTRYFRWFESARIAYFERIGLRVSEPSAIGPILAATTCDFLRPLNYPADLSVGACVPTMGRTSFTMEYAVALSIAPNQHCARGSGVIVLINYESGEKVPIPDAMRDAIEATG